MPDDKDLQNQQNQQDQQNPGDGGQGDNQNQPEPKTLTQDEVNRILQERLARERRKWEKELEQYKQAAEELRKLKEAQMSEEEKLQARLAEYERKVADLELALAEARLESAKLRILDELGLPKAFASRLFGTTEEELRQDAQELAKLLNSFKPVGNPTNPPNNNQPTFTRAQLALMSPEEINSRWDEISRALAEGRVK